MMIGDLIQGREKSQTILIEGLHILYNCNISKNVAVSVCKKKGGGDTRWLNRHPREKLTLFAGNEVS